ncbi:MAG TPA: hypothetical protein VIG30_12155 [Ktedonobacterales bacterium]|jgi:Tol biopolymer transport system component
MVATLAYSTFRLDRSYRRVEWALYLAESDGSRRQRLVAERDWTTFAWAPNGQQLAYIAAPDPQDAAAAGLYVVMADGSHPRRVASDPHLHTVWWSPDSRLLAFITKRSEGSADRVPLAHLSVIGADGSNPRRLASDLSLYFPAWSPDSRHLALLSSPHPAAQAMSTLWLLAADGADARRLIEGDGDLRALCWLADSRRLSVMRYRGGDTLMYLVDGVTGALDRFGPIRESVWSPDTSSVAYVVMPDENEDASAVYITDAERHGIRHWTFAGRPDLSLALWSPDGQRLALPVDEHLSVFEMRGAHSGPLAELYWDTEFTWSPDGSMIAFIGMLDEPSDEAPDSGAALEVIDVVRQQRRVLARDVQIVETVPDTPLWSPDGRQIAFTAFADDGTEDVCVIDADGTNRRPLSQSAPEDFIDVLVWRPDPRQPSRSGG